MEENHDKISLASQEKVLIEKDGQFELVSTEDVQAEIKGVDTDLETSQVDNNKNASRGSETVVSDIPTINVTSEGDDKDKSDQVSSEPAEPHPLEQNKAAKDNNKVEITNGSPLIHKEEKNPNDLADSVQNETKKSQKETSIKRKIVSAPSGLQNEKEKSKERELLNEKAFQRWIEKKNAELLAQRQEERKKMVSKESLESRLERNHRAFEGWLKNKQKALSAQNVEKSQYDDGVKKEEERKKEIKDHFKMWLNKKAEQRAMSAKADVMREKEINELAKKVEPNVADKAYKE